MRGRSQRAKQKRPERDHIGLPVPTSAHDILVAIYKNPLLPIDTRLEAAKAAIAYEKPRLAAIQHSGDKDAPMIDRIELVVVDTGVPSSDRADLSTRPPIRNAVANLD
jgi:hypothetical protein